MLSGDREEQKHWARELFDSRNTMEYFLLLKKLFEEDVSSWVKVREEIIEKVSKSSYHSHILYDIFREESLLDRFSEKLEKELSLLDT